MLSFLGVIFLAFIAYSIWSGHQKKKQEKTAKAVAGLMALGMAARYEKAEALFGEHLDNEYEPNWYVEGQPESASFMGMVRTMALNDGIPLPFNAEEEAFYNKVLLAAASAMEDVGGDKGEQAAYAATKIKLFFHLKGDSPAVRQLFGE